MCAGKTVPAVWSAFKVPHGVIVSVMYTSTCHAMQRRGIGGGDVPLCPDQLTDRRLYRRFAAIKPEALAFSVARSILENVPTAFGLPSLSGEELAPKAQSSSAAASPASSSLADEEDRLMKPALEMVKISDMTRLNLLVVFFFFIVKGLEFDDGFAEAANVETSGGDDDGDGGAGVHRPAPLRSPSSPPRGPRRRCLRPSTPALVPLRILEMAEPILAFRSRRRTALATTSALPIASTV